MSSTHNFVAPTAVIVPPGYVPRELTKIEYETNLLNFAKYQKGYRTPARVQPVDALTREEKDAWRQKHHIRLNQSAKITNLTAELEEQIAQNARQREEITALTAELQGHRTRVASISQVVGIRTTGSESMADSAGVTDKDANVQAKQEANERPNMAARRQIDLQTQEPEVEANRAASTTGCNNTLRDTWHKRAQERFEENVREFRLRLQGDLEARAAMNSRGTVDP